MKKTITITMIVILLFNLISIKSFAVEDSNEMFPLETLPQESGKVGITNEEGKETEIGITGTTYSGSQTFKTVANVLTAFPQVINQFLDIIVQTTTEENVDYFTIYDTVLGHYELFNIDYTDVPETIEEDSSVMEHMKFYVIKYYGVTRRISIAVSLFVLIYIGIRMAISTIASDKAKYQKMLIDWLASLVLIFVMHIIIITISVVLQQGLAVVEKIADAWRITEFEEQIYSGAIKNLTSKGFNVFTTVVIIYILTWYQVKFFLMYVHRTIEVGFLIMVSPLVTITYSIDKAGDNKAQAYRNLIKEIITKTTIQLLHAIMYVVFIATAGVIATSQPILAIIFFAALSRIEKIIRKVFSINESGLENVQVPFT